MASAAETTYRGSIQSPAEIATDVLFVPVWGETDALTDLPWLDEATGKEVSRARAAGEFKSALYDAFVTPVSGTGCRARRVALVGAGAVADAGAERVRRIGALCGLAARDFRAASYAVLVRGGIDSALAAQHLTDGCVAASFDGGVYRDQSHRKPQPAEVVIVAPAADEAGIAAGVERGRVISECANATRALANEPSNILTTEELATRASAMGRSAGLSVEILDEKRLAELEMRLLLGVGQGSTHRPRMVIFRHDPAGAPAAPVVGLIGKGVTFDTGGVSIKPAEGMERMKSDMSGAAAVTGAMVAIARLGIPRRVIGVIPIAENMVGGNAIRPGDVLRGANGKTVEVINTDAEGRLILADALWYAQKLGCTHLVDVATLTGACSVALGRHVSGLLGRPDEWVDRVRAAGTRAGDRLWSLPIYEEARQQLKSEIADMMNVGGRPGGAITAAAFLQEFTGELPWAHLDIAGTAWAESKEPYQPKGATGVAVRTLIEIANSAE